MSSRKSEILHFHGLLLSKSYKVSVKKVQKSYILWHWRVMQSLKKNWLLVSNMKWEIWWIFTHPLKSLKISLRWALFVQSIQGLSYKNTKELPFMTLNSDARLEYKPWPCGFNNGMRNWVNFHFIFKSLKNCTLMGSFSPEHIMFHLKSFKGIICHVTEEWCKI